MQITKTVEFDMAHRLMYHEGQCRNIHGHHYVVEVVVDGSTSKHGMVIDFADLKKQIQTVIVSDCDHALALNKEDSELIVFCIEHGFKFRVFESDPTAEVMAQEFLDLMRIACKMVVLVTVYETATSSATARFVECE